MTRTLLRGGRVTTGAAERGLAAQRLDLVVDDGTLAWLGGPEELPAGRAPDRIVDLDGRLVTPAFTDSHVHLAATGFAAMGADLSSAQSPAEALDLVARHARTSTLGVVLAHGWDETRWAGSSPFTRAEVDRAAGGRPAYVSRVDLHSAVASTALLDAVRSARGDLLDGPEGLVGLDGWSDQGPLTREAHHAVRGALQQLLSAADRSVAIDHALRAAASRGLGLVHELGAPHLSEPGDFAAVDRLRGQASAEGRALPAVVGYWGEAGAAGLDTARTLGCLGAAGDLCVDGALGSRTAALHAGYADRPDTVGHLYLEPGAIAEHVAACTRAGLQAGFHVIGDRAVSVVLEGLEAARERVGTASMRAARHRLEHLEMVDADQAARLADLGVLASVQPMFDCWWGGTGGLYDTRLGARSQGMNPLATLAAAGVALAFGSDSPVTPLDPWGGARAAVHHHTEAERLDASAAFAAHTAGGWLAAGRDAGGRLHDGAPAFLAVWDTEDDPESVLADPTRPLPPCVLTLVGGDVAFDGEGLMS